MKKLITLSLAALFSVCLLTACGEKTPPVEKPPDEGQTADVLTILDTAYTTENYAIAVQKDNTELLDAINGALAELKADGTVDAIIAKYIDGVANELVFQQDVAADAPTLTMGTNATFPPYEFYEGQAIVGIDAEIAAAIADKLGMKLVIEDMEFDSVIIAVQSGNIDMGMAGMTVTEERMQTVNFTDSYATGVQVVIVKEGSPIASVDDLFAEGANHKVGVQLNTTGDIYATGNIEDAGLGTIERYNKATDTVQALVNGQVDCVIIDNGPAQNFVDFYNAQ